MELPVSNQTALTALALAAGVLGYGIAHLNKGDNTALPPPTPAPSFIPPGSFEAEPLASGKEDEIKASETSKKSTKSKPKKKAAAKTVEKPVVAAAPEPVAVAPPPAPEPTEEKTKAKKRKPKKKVSSQAVAVPAYNSLAEDTDGSWTQVGHAASRPVTTDAPTASEDSEPETKRKVEERKPLAERVLPKQRKTKVDDMVPSDDPLAPPTIARVMRVAPRPEEKPADGFSWGDYEDVDRDGDDEGGWGVVKSKRSKTQLQRPASTDPSTTSSSADQLSKKQRQNQKKRDAEKQAKAAAEAERLKVLAKHKKELEKERRIKAAYESGGMKAVVADGKLVWE